MGFQLPWYWTLIALAVLVVLTHLQVRLAIKATAHAALQSFDSVGPGRIRDVGYDFDGTMHVHNINFQPVDDTRGISIGEIVIEPPGLWWVVRQTLPGGRKSRRGDAHDYPPTQSLTVKLRNIEWGDFYLGYAIPRMDWTGSYTGALFEAEGCPDDGFWARSDLSDRLKLDPGSGDIEIKFEVAGERGLVRTVHFGHAGLSELTMVSTYDLPESAAHFLDIPVATWRTTSTRWLINDHGFIERRNQFCADAAGVDLATMLDRHLQSVDRLLAVRGTRASPELRDAYAIYARDGGTLEFQTGLPPGRAWEDYTRFGLEGLLAGIAATVTVGDRRAAYLLTEIPARPLPDAEYGSTWTVLNAESGNPEVLPASPPSAGKMLRPPATREATTQAEIASVKSPLPPSTPPIAKNESIEKLVGQRVELLLQGNRKLRGTLESLDLRQLELRVRVGGGYAQMTLQRHRVLSSRRL